MVAVWTSWTRIGTLACGGVLIAAFTTLSTASAEPSAHDSMAGAFTHAAARYDVPRDLLVALAYSETHLDGHDGAPSSAGGYGVMHLVSNPTTTTLERAARLTGLSVGALRADTAANIIGGAAVLRAHADDHGLDPAARRDPARWYGAVARYGGASDPSVARLYADTVFDFLAHGIDTTTPAGERVTVAARPVAPDRGRLAAAGDVGIQSTDYPPAHWVPANAGNYTVANRPSSHAVDLIVIHVAQGSYAGTISWFQNPASNVSSHYVIRSSDGDVTQMVRDKDIAFHVRSANSRSLGIEHEGFINNPSWFTDAMYRSSAALTRHLCDKFGLPKNRTTVKGHNEIPGNDHTDPGPHWNWTFYMQLVTGGGGGTWSQTVDNATGGRFTASANWGTSSFSSQRHGADYRFADPVAASDAAWYKFAVPSVGTYRVDVWYPALAGYNATTPYVVLTTAGSRTVYVDQRSGGGMWRTIGTFSLAAGDRDVVAVSRWSSSSGYVIADAVRLVRV